MPSKRPRMPTALLEERFPWRTSLQGFGFWAGSVHGQDHRERLCTKSRPRTRIPPGAHELARGGALSTAPLLGPSPTRWRTQSSWSRCCDPRLRGSTAGRRGENSTTPTRNSSGKPPPRNGRTGSAQSAVRGESDHYEPVALLTSVVDDDSNDGTIAGLVYRWACPPMVGRPSGSTTRSRRSFSRQTSTSGSRGII